MKHRKYCGLAPVVHAPRELSRFLRREDGRYVGAFAAVIFGAFLLLSLRLGFSALAALLLVRGLSGLSRLKFKHLQMSLHAYDFVYFLGDRTVVVFVLTKLGSITRRPLAILFSAVALLSLICFVEPAELGRTAAAATLLTTVAALTAARRYCRPAAQRSGSWTYFEDPVNLPCFVDSIYDAFKACRRGGVLASEPVGGDDAPAWSSAPASDPPRGGPNIVLILNESTFPPWIHRPIPHDPALAGFFRSVDGRSYGLRVETFGGATWQTEFSVLTGIPAGSYGPFSAHVFHWASNKIRGSLVQYLKRLQYRTAMVNPMPKDFIRSDRFYRSIGIDEMIDQTVHGAPSVREFDEFYFACALNWLERHFSTDERPAFLYVMTMYNHSPHDYRFVDDRGRRVESEIADDIFDEYMRRLRRTADDYADFRAALAKRFPDRQFLILRFGDHQPSFTRRFFSREVERNAAPGKVADGEALYRTYFAIDGVNFDPNVDRDLPDTIESAYLGAVLLRAAGIPLDAAHALRRDLMIRHAGRLYFADADGRLAARHNRHMIEAGLVLPH